MKITVPNTNKVISTKFPRDIYKEICISSNIPLDLEDPLRELKVTQIETIIIKSISKFIEGSIATEQLADIANHLYTIYLKTAKAEGPLNDVLNAASELTFYIRTKNNTHTLETFRNTILDYYSAHSE